MSVAMSVASAETVPSPLQQVRNGVSANEVKCAEDRILVLSPSGKPACVFESSLDILAQRGFVQVLDGNSEESHTADADQIPPLRGGPHEPPLMNPRDYLDRAEIILGSFDELQSIKHAPRQSSLGEFVVADWIPDYIPNNYRLVHAVHTLNYQGDIICHYLYQR